MSELIRRSDVIEEIARRDTTDGTVKVFSGREVADILHNLPSAQSEIIRCKDCKHFEYDHPYIIQGIPVLGHEVCNAWGYGCKTDENGYCFMAERRTDETD